MPYELAKQLKEAGFSQELTDPSSYYKTGYTNSPRLFGWSDGEDKPQQSDGRGNVKVPTLEELIEECGDKSFNLVRHGDGWVPNAGQFNFCTTPGTRGSTPTEAVARMWLALNKTIRQNKKQLSPHSNTLCAASASLPDICVSPCINEKLHAPKTSQNHRWLPLQVREHATLSYYFMGS